MDTTPLAVLVVDDDPNTRSTLREMLEFDDYHVSLAGSVQAALEHNHWDRLFAIIVDRKLPDGSADELLPQLRRLAPQAAMIVVTGYADLDGAVSALRAGSTDYLLKPVQPGVLRNTLRQAAERRQLDIARRRSETAFRRLVESAESVILILRTDLSLAYFSPFAERLTGYRAEEVLGKNVVDVFAATCGCDIMRSQFQLVFEGEAIRGIEAPICCRDGSPRWMFWSAQLLTDYEDGPCILAVGQDCTNLKDAQVKVLQSERLAAIGQMVTGLAHESRNALQRSQACLGMLATRLKDQPECQQLLAGLQEAHEHLYRLYEEVRGYAAPIKLRPQNVDVVDILQESWSHVRSVMPDRAAWLEVVRECEDTNCDADRMALQQVFRNIFENAVAAVEEPPRLAAHLFASGIDRRPALIVSVRDNGPGLTEEQLSRIFEPFYTTKIHGTGLGMPISRRLVEAHGGQIEIGPPGPPGTEVLVTLPRRST